MKKIILKIALFSFISVTIIACKNKNEETASVGEKDVVEASNVAIDYNVNVEKSVVYWKGSKPTGSHNGTIKLASGSVAVTNGNIEAGKFKIDMNSITSLDLDGRKKSNLESHLKGTVEGKEGDFFNVTEYPFSTFELISIDGEGEKVTVHGYLTIKDEKIKIEFPATVSFPKNDMILKSVAFTIDRTKWGVNYGSKSIFENLGDKFINDEIELVIELHANKS